MSFEVLKGKVLSDVRGANIDSEEIVFTCSDGTSYKMYHSQDCCEHVRVEDITGDISDLLGSEILSAEEVSENAAEKVSDSGTWTFYKLASIKGSVTIRWLGESNGYYSEEVSFQEI